MPRDPGYEQRFLREAVAAAARAHGVHDHAFVDQVTARLAEGQRLYGDSWLGKNLPAEGREEGLDGGAYAVLDAQKQLAAITPDSDQHAFHLFEAAVHAVAMAWHFQQARSE